MTFHSTEPTPSSSAVILSPRVTSASTGSSGHGVTNLLPRPGRVSSRHSCPGPGPAPPPRGGASPCADLPAHRQGPQRARVPDKPGEGGPWAGSPGPALSCFLLTPVPRDTCTVKPGGGGASLSGAAGQCVQFTAHTVHTQRENELHRMQAEPGKSTWAAVRCR